MNRAAREAERMNNIHLYMLVVMTAAVVLEIVFGYFMEWEAWMSAIILAAVSYCWVIHVRGIFSPARRRLINALIIWLMFIFHGVHATSLFDMTQLIVVELLLFSQVDDKRFLHVSVLVYLFCFVWQMITFLPLYLEEVQNDMLLLSRILLHLFVTGFTYWVSILILDKRMQDRNRYAERISELRDTQKRTEDFLADVSHELRTPIHTVMGIAGVMIGRAKSIREKQNVEQVFRAGRRLSAQIDSVMDYAEIEAGKIKLVAEPYMLSSVLNDVITDMDLYNREGLPDVLFDVDADLPLKLVGDSRFLKKILAQVIENGIKFTKEGGVYVSLYGDRRAYGINLCIDVQDTGIGMSKRTLERIRSTTYQKDTERTRRAGGLGLGFSIVSGLVRAMDGFYTITSAPGKGTQVHISIPQEILDDTRCMDVPHPEQLKVAFYQNPAKFKVPVVRDFYAMMIRHVIQNFKLTLQRVTTEDDLRSLLAEQVFTHLFTADEEYDANPAFYEKLCETMHVIVVAKNTFRVPETSGITILRKPLYAFPLAALLNAESAEEARQVLSEKERVSFDRIKALVVDDEIMNLKVAQELFADYGMEVTPAGSGEEALHKVREQSFDIIFMDHMMPGMDGVECMRRIRMLQAENRKKSIIIALTANALSTSREMFIGEGFDAFIAKPVERHVLERTLKSVLSGRNIRRS